MKIIWSHSARLDLIRIHEFLAAANPRAADAVARMLADAARGLRDFPRRGAKLEAYAKREVRRLIVGQYELRYEIVDQTVTIVRLFHGREDR